MHNPTCDRRQFLASLGAVSAAGLVAPDLQAHRAAGQGDRGLVRAADDFALAPGLVYLQTGSLGPTPRPVMAAAIAAWQELERNPVLYGYGDHEHRLEDVRSKAAACLRCATEELVLTGSTTEGMNWVAQGLSFAPGDRVLTTDQEHPGGRACWDYVVRRHGVVLDIVPIPPAEHDPRGIVARFAGRVTARTKVLSFSHVLSSTGLRMPVAELSGLARARGCLSVVDGAQAVGGIDVDVKALGCHAYATSGHKWLLGTKGTGLLYLSAETGKAIDPIALEGGRAAYSNSSGVCSLPSVLALGTALDYRVAIGPARIETYNLALRNRLFNLLGSIPRVRVVSAAPGPMASPMLAYELPQSVPARDLHVRLRERHNVEVKVVPGQWFNGHRISTHLFNTPSDVDALVAALKAELA
jgi:selenocysteine lyase/cysteine desulfurase